MRNVFYAGAPPLAPLLLKRRRKRDEIRVRSGHDLCEHLCERRGVTKVALHRGCSSFSFPQGVKGESLAHDIFAAKLKVS